MGILCISFYCHSWWTSWQYQVPTSHRREEFKYSKVRSSSTFTWFHPPLHPPCPQLHPVWLLWDHLPHTTRYCVLPQCGPTSTANYSITRPSSHESWGFADNNIRKVSQAIVYPAIEEKLCASIHERIYNKIVVNRNLRCLEANRPKLNCYSQEKLMPSQIILYFCPYVRENYIKAHNSLNYNIIPL